MMMLYKKSGESNLLARSLLPCRFGISIAVLAFLGNNNTCRRRYTARISQLLLVPPFFAATGPDALGPAEQELLITNSLHALTDNRQAL